MAQSFQLTVKTGPNPGKIYDLVKEEVVVGRDLGNDIVISDADISRRHAHFVLQGDVYLLEDLGSTNGTYVNGERLTGPQLLMGGETIMFGSTVELTFSPVGFDVAATMIAPPHAAAPAEPVVVAPAQVEPAVVEPAEVAPVILESVPVINVLADEPALEPAVEAIPEPPAAPVVEPEPVIDIPPYNAPEPAYSAPEPVYSTPEPVISEVSVETEPPQNSKKGLWIGIGIGCFVLACLCIVGTVAVILWQSGAFG